ncbi:MAG: hypothetical protein H6Q33_4341 [Deltaproteobacteria bacterium]|nr:hypothetical protein [Deltaproteobacteria bacterium]
MRWWKSDVTKVTVPVPKLDEAIAKVHSSGGRVVEPRIAIRRDLCRTNAGVLRFMCETSVTFIVDSFRTTFLGPPAGRRRLREQA